MEYGFECVVSPSFGDIFHTNASKNGLLLVPLPEPLVRAVLDEVRTHPGRSMAVDLETTTVTFEGLGTHRFEIRAKDRQRLLEGMDDIDVTLTYAARIDHFERERQARYPWSVVTGTGTPEPRR
jgi:3-isopropylmalate/(R)-2-methylmalate dehydratase small subunit